MSKPKILIVDDEPFNLDYLEQELEDLNFEIVLAENGRDALAKVNEESPDLILLDIMMPLMDGFEVLGHLKGEAATRDTPVIVISASSDLRSMVKGIQLGAEDYLPKPFEPTLLRARIASSLEKKQLRDLQHLYLRSLEREMEIGREIQQGFLPRELPHLPAWEIASSFQAARTVAGDFYDAFSLVSEEKLCLVIADVCDKGVGAALFMTLFRSLLRFTMGVTDILGKPSASARLNHAAALTNDYIAETHGDTGMFATVFFGLLDPTEGTLAYVNAGHESPVVISPQATCISLKRTGPALGAIPGATFRVEEVCLQEGDMLFAYTDGAPDALAPDGERFGRDRLLSMLCADIPAELLLKNVQRTLLEFSAGTEQFDDITLLAVRRLL
jgi:phosphoserine phosphatase RsbU/P